MTSVRAIKLLLSQRRKWIGEPAMIEMRERIFNRKKVVERHKIRKMISISRTMCIVHCNDTIRYATQESRGEKIQ